ncbi:hypothetical protein MMC29_001139 [Sticta canariensis]|nr:hypothetical protein [Sticta canariensis]
MPIALLTIRLLPRQSLRIPSAITESLLRLRTLTAITEPLLRLQTPTAFTEPPQPAKRAHMRLNIIAHRVAKVRNGIVIGVVAFFSAIGAAFTWLYRRRKRRSAAPGASAIAVSVEEDHGSPEYFKQPEPQVSQTEHISREGEYHVNEHSSHQIIRFIDSTDLSTIYTVYLIYFLYPILSILSPILVEIASTNAAKARDTVILADISSWDQWFENIQATVPEQFWKYFDPDSKAVMLEPVAPINQSKSLPLQGSSHLGFEPLAWQGTKGRKTSTTKTMLSLEKMKGSGTSSTISVPSYENKSS